MLDNKEIVFIKFDDTRLRKQFLNWGEIEPGMLSDNLFFYGHSFSSESNMQFCIDVFHTGSHCFIAQENFFSHFWQCKNFYHAGNLYKKEYFHFTYHPKFSNCHPKITTLYPFLL